MLKRESGPANIDADAERECSETDNEDVDATLAFSLLLHDVMPNTVLIGVASTTGLLSGECRIDHGNIPLLALRVNKQGVPIQVSRTEIILVVILKPHVRKLRESSFRWSYEYTGNRTL